MIVAFTGHRPNKIGGYRVPNPVQQWICKRIREELQSHHVVAAISGMALGVDQWAAQIVLDLGVSLIAAIPFKGQESQWPELSQKEYRRLLHLAHEIVTVCEGSYAVAKMQKRNEWMVDHCDLLIAVWDGSSGGTGNCVKYAQETNTPIVYIVP